MTMSDPELERTERVSDIVARLRHPRHIPQKEYGTASAFVMETVEQMRRERAEAADIIEAQSKALAEARTTGAIVEIAAERQRQKSVEGWTEAHDNEHETGQMASAAACYASPEDFKTKTVPREWSDDSRYMDAQSEPLGRVSVPSAWPWDGQWWKPSDPRRNLVKAAALIVAEIERLDRLTPTPENPNG